MRRVGVVHLGAADWRRPGGLPEGRTLGRWWEALGLRCGSGSGQGLSGGGEGGGGGVSREEKGNSSDLRFCEGPFS